MKKSVKRRKIGVFNIINYLLLGLFALCAFYPFVYTLAGSFNDAMDTAYGPVWLIPRKFTAASYYVVLSDSRMYRAALNTFVSTVAVLFLSLLLTSCVAYAMSNPRLRGKKFFWFANLLTMFFHGGMIPSYMVIVLTGLYDNFLVYILPGCFSVYNMIIITNFFKSIDQSLYEAAVVDGASELKIWLKIYIPLSTPVLATVGLWIVVAKWNAYMATMLYTAKKAEMWLLQYYLMRLIREGDMSGAVDSVYYGEVSAQSMSFAAIVITTIPILCLYPLLSRYFSKGIMMGSLKG